MSEKVIKPDLKFAEAVVAAGGESMKKCYQCATCSVVCNVTPEDNPFPRKEMIQAQWGLKDELMANPDIWLCHQCSDCTAYCPRGAKPGEVLGAIRQMSIKEFSKPAFLANLAGSPGGMLPLIAIPVVIIGLVMAMLGRLPFSAIPLVDGKVSFREMLPLFPYLDAIFVAAISFGAGMVLLGAKSYWDHLSKNNAPQGDFVGALVATLKDILAHKKFDQCDVQSGRKFAHLLVLYSFIGLAITTGISAFYEWVLNRWTLHEGYAAVPFTDPLKWIGNVSALALLVGIVLVIMNRMATAEKAGSGSFYDWSFIGLVLTLGASGFLAQLFRVANISSLAYTLYFIHLVSIFYLFAFAPYTKMAHMVYRTTAMVFSNMTGRK